MKLMNIADEGAQYKWQLYDLYDKAETGGILI